ncbi:Spo0E like sporulation regulatory protein [Bacillus sp. THAF10]|uniref:aspartyl-phosphate phosphatase Spo0E family protein n=1 Tax=Bacillus sp. THAF10 TaxID=2587848 RepID=UPI0012695732|nr:aspartyl-phosphate phosphatase Spo0E family protein [Bacillus sp. THAF10]QFT87235.1 Spo0E like sporulation regulatory protein [Bacillus sp. THAF10]
MGIYASTTLQEAIERKREEMIRLSHTNHLLSKEVIDASTTLDSLINQHLYQQTQRKPASSS